MISVRDSVFYSQVLKEINYKDGDVFIFDGFVVAEMNYGIIYTWEDHAKPIVEDVSSFLKTNGNNIIYISNRINSYSVNPSDWLKFFTNNYSLKGYGVVSQSRGSLLNTVIENLFFNKKIKRFSDLNAALQWAQNKVLVDIDN